MKKLTIILVLLALALSGTGCGGGSSSKPKTPAQRVDLPALEIEGNRILISDLEAAIKTIIENEFLSGITDAKVKWRGDQIRVAGQGNNRLRAQIYLHGEKEVTFFYTYSENIDVDLVFRAKCTGRVAFNIESYSVKANRAKGIVENKIKELLTRTFDTDIPCDSLQVSGKYIIVSPPGTSVEEHTYSAAPPVASKTGGAWAIVMSKGTGFITQSWHTRSAFPKDAIREKWAAGYDVTELAYRDGTWAVVMSKGTGFTTQSWATRTQFPQDFITEKWDAGYSVTSLVYGDGKWAIVMSKGTGFTTQSWATRSEFPEDFIDEKWNAGYEITSLAYGDGKWAVVMSKGTDFTTQSWHTRSAFPKDIIDQKWDAGYDITTLVYGNGQWAVVMSKGTGFNTQSWATRTEFPQDYITEKWEADYDISVLAGRGGS